MAGDTSLSRDEIWMRKSAMHYLGQRASNIASLRRVLARRAQRRLAPDADAAAMIERTIDYCSRNGFVDDAAFVEMKIRSGRSRGLSVRRIEAALGAKGVDRTLVAEALDADERRRHEEVAAARLARRRRIGPWRRPDREFDPHKEVAVMVRGGFSASLARRIVTAAPEEAESLAADDGRVHEITK
ncbi:regulatory protein RecX [Labrys monachus]|uniref:Regulatory protein RecX n=1 Tax=Labrys monachus TaxID=217067 RepID=A0ABU0FEV6_9HYPH|nr:regulatory protein RecX [Labrys monachus]MDQ0392986.1 regulatory protein [Labrys monachus]